MPTKRISLDGKWQFTSADDLNWKEGMVPGCVQLDLMTLGELPDPFYRMNEYYYQALEEKEWIYRKTFTLDDLSADRIRLVLEGVDTLADVYLNDVHLGRLENMFISHEYGVKTILRQGENILEIRFDSPVKTIRALYRNNSARLIGGSEPGRSFVRKAQYSYGWDWGPRIAQVGIWRPVHLDYITEGKIIHPYLQTLSVENGTAKVKVEGGVFSFKPGELTAEISIALQGEKVAGTAVGVQENPRGLGFAAELSIPEVRLWFPNGLGGQPLYDVALVLRRGGEIVDEAGFKTGIRTVRIIQEKDEEGETFIFEINGVKVFAKGACWIPADNMLPRLTARDYRKYVELARDANMNMLRVWGGGIYEDQSFYEACDEMGVMVWQDFMYACAQYPDDHAWFRKLAEEEAVSVVRGLRNHPSIVLWCGNNENNQGFYSWWGNGDPEYLGNYVYKKILPEVCAQNDPARPYWTSSPYGGKDPNGMEAGDRHNWEIWHGWASYERYIFDHARFLSEFGLQAMPDWKTVLSFTEPEDRRIFSPVLLSHNKSFEGMEKILRYLAGQVGLPRDLKSFVYLSQFNQAEAIRTGVEHWRCRKFKTAGALFWQFNDCWPTASWSCLDNYKRKKGLYHYSRRFFAEILPVIRLEEGELAVYGISDLTENKKALLRVTAYRLDGKKLGETVSEITLWSNDAVKLSKYTLAELGIGFSERLMVDDECHNILPALRNGDLLDAVVFAELALGGRLYKNYKVFARFRHLKPVKPDIKLTADANTAKLLSRVPAFGVFLETEKDVDLSDNCLILEPGVECTVTFSGDPGRIEIFDITGLTSEI
ncbi:MAG: beta-mannosidase [Bacillota bacterium]